MENTMEYRQHAYFDSESTYLFDNNLGTEFESKVDGVDENGRGVWYTTAKGRSQYKATSVKCKRLTNPQQ